jgi:hypothetical protein
VEGYTDQQMFTYLLPYVKNYSFAAGTGIIDVGGKDELGVFFTVCSLLGTNGRIITDLDSLFSGKLRSACSKDVRVKGWLDKNYERQLEFYKKIFSSKELSSVITLEKLIYKLEFLLLGIGREINNSSNCSRKIRAFKEAVSAIYSKYSNAEGLDTFKTVVMQGINRHYDLLRQYLPKRLAATLPYIQTLFNIILAAFEASRVYILPKGCIEHYYIVETSGFMPVSAKDRKFHKELESILKGRPGNIVHQYAELIEILERACR